MVNEILPSGTEAESCLHIGVCPIGALALRALSHHMKLAYSIAQNPWREKEREGEREGEKSPIKPSLFQLRLQTAILDIPVPADAMWTRRTTQQNSANP